MRHFPLRELGYAIGFIVLLAAIYVGSYYAMVIPSDLDPAKLPLRGSISATFYASPVYRFGGNTSAQFFGLANKLDRKLRPGQWECHVVMRDWKWERSR
jgi:hypothetical protein